METTRQNKISRLIQKDLSEIFQHLSREHFKNAMITVTKVKVSPDLSGKLYVLRRGLKCLSGMSRSSTFLPPNLQMQVPHRK